MNSEVSHIPVYLIAATMWNMMCDVMPTIAEDSLGQRGQFSADEANFEQLMVNILDERDKLLETLRDTQENLANSHIKLNDLTKEKEALQRQLQANLPQVIIYLFFFFTIENMLYRNVVLVSVFKAKKIVTLDQKCIILRY